MRIITKREEQLLFEKIKTDAEKQAKNEIKKRYETLLSELNFKIYKAQSDIIEDSIKIDKVATKKDFFAVYYSLGKDVLKKINGRIGSIITKEIDKLENFLE